MEPAVAICRIRITVASHNVKSLEKICADLLRGTKEKNLIMKGLVKRPTKTLRVTARKGSQTWDPFQMRFYKGPLICTVLMRLVSR
ncbi:unnamed protein product [Gulo gulo]|uniref:Small ribosomal subunit protein uS10 domain-containing protein n=1 Tax=Gulo gulo TaxID=48420 RepID=A0A9X9LKZ8_GULGU|nr:unnamed protein product [Gulo gulo]